MSPQIIRTTIQLPCAMMKMHSPTLCYTSHYVFALCKKAQATCLCHKLVWMKPCFLFKASPCNFNETLAPFELIQISLHPQSTENSKPCFFRIPLSIFITALMHSITVVLPRDCCTCSNKRWTWHFTRCPEDNLPQLDSCCSQWSPMANQWWHQQNPRDS